MSTETKKLDPTAEGSLTFMHPFDATEDPENVDQRTITAEGMRRLKWALEKAPAMMLARPVILDIHAVSVGGNHRLRASKEMIGDGEFPKFNEFVTKHHGIPFFIRDFESAAERREWRVRDNADYASWTEDGLAAVVRQHKEDGGDLLLLGLDESKLDSLLSMTEPSAGAGDDDDGGGGPDPMPDVWGVVVECDGEAQQGELLERLNREGYTCRALL